VITAFLVTIVGRCVPIRTVLHSLASSTNASAGSVITYTCNPGHLYARRYSHIYISCVAGAWNDTDHECERKLERDLLTGKVHSIYGSSDKWVHM